MIVEPFQDEINVYRGRINDYSFLFTEDDEVTPIDLSGFTPDGQLRESSDDGSTLWADLTFDVTNLATGILLAYIDDQARAIPDTTGGAGSVGYFDIVMIDGGGDKYPYVFGYANIRELPTVVP